MTHDDAQRWAIGCLSRMLDNSNLRLKRAEAQQAAEAMTALTGSQWCKAIKHSPNAPEHWRVFDTGQSVQHSIELGNVHKGGTL